MNELGEMVRDSLITILSDVFVVGFADSVKLFGIPASDDAVQGMLAYAVTEGCGDDVGEEKLKMLYDRMLPQVRTQLQNKGVIPSE